jgi:hypothetical protein
VIVDLTQGSGMIPKMDWLWQGLATNWLSGLVVFLMGGATFWARVKSYRYLSPILYALAAMALTEVFIFAVNAQHSFVVEQSAKTTTDNVEHRVRDWLDAFRLKVQNSPAEAFIFQYTVTMGNGDLINVTRAKERPNYVIVHSRLQLNADGIKKKLSAAQTERLIQDMTNEAARAKINSAVVKTSLSEVYLEKRILITGALTEDVLINAIDEMDYAVTLLRGIANSELTRSSR